MTTDTKAVARFDTSPQAAMWRNDTDGDYVYFEEHEDVVAELRSALAAKSAEVEGYRMALEVIAIGSSHNAMSDASEALVSSGFWSASMEKSNEHQDQ